MAEEDEQDWLNAVAFLAGYQVQTDKGINEIKYLSRRALRRKRRGSRSPAFFVMTCP